MGGRPEVEEARYNTGGRRVEGSYGGQYERGASEEGGPRQYRRAEVEAAIEVEGAKPRREARDNTGGRR